jgi:ferric enterobactin receptor
MKLKHLLIAIFSLLTSMSFAQPGQRPPGKGPGTIGRIYGKVIDEQKKGIEYAIVKVFKETKLDNDSIKSELIGGGLTAGNGDFAIEQIPMSVALIVSIEALGYDTKKIPFILEKSSEKDLGNISLLAGKTMGEVVIESESPSFRLEFDKRVFDVDKNPMSAGGTAEDVLKSIPSVQVDLDGNVSMRNASPQIFIDGRPTTLTIDQIPADAIQRVEIITNPSSKYDASGGGGGIINIVMKNNRASGYNGSVRAGVDKRGRFNSGVDFNFREGKFNFFINGNFNKRKSITTGESSRIDFTTSPNSFLNQSQMSTNIGYFGNGKVGIDWFLDNRNTFTLSQSYTSGQFNPTDYIESVTDSLDNSDAFPTSKYYRNTETNRTFENFGTSLLFKHLFEKEGNELTGDINYNKIRSDYIGDYENAYNSGTRTVQRQTGGGKQNLITSQFDLVLKPSEKLKIESGMRGSIRNYESNYSNFTLDTEGNYNEITGLGVNYKFIDQVYAAYTNIAHDGVKWKKQVGLRIESSDYRGELLDTTVTFKNTFPLSLFPSLYLTRVINEKQDVQLAMSRRISRPGFMQLIPFTDYSDSLNVSRGNPSLKPEFTQSAELSYQLKINQKSTLIASAYYRYTLNTTVRYLETQYSDVLGRDVVFSTYANASNSTATGLELVMRNTFNKWLEMTTNLNLYNSTIDGTNITEGLTNNRSSFWLKSNIMFRLPKNTTFQTTFDYSSKKALDVGSSERGGSGGGGFGGGPGGGGGFGGTSNTVQGYVEPIYGLDLSIKKDFLKNRSLSVTLSMSDVLRTRVTKTHTESVYFIQDTFRRRDPQIWRLQVSWKFGKVDSTLFKRKNTKSGNEMMEG